MLSKEEFIRYSLEINLFFQRIMKEHLFFIQTNLQPVEADLIREANLLKQRFEQLLAETVYYANDVISESVIKSNELVTPYTLRAEKVTSMLTGASLNTEITEAELKLVSNPGYDYGAWLDVVRDINKRSYDLLEEIIAFQKKLAARALKCEIFITLYHEMLEHVTREAEYYRAILRSLLTNNKPPVETLCGELNFWNNIMGEHAQFIDGMLDPTERLLKKVTKTTAENFEWLVEECMKAAAEQIIQISAEATEGIREFKKDATEGILQCRIKSIIPPLLADHVLREANHYLRFLRNIQ